MWEWRQWVLRGGCNCRGRKSRPSNVGTVTPPPGHQSPVTSHRPSLLIGLAHHMGRRRRRRRRSRQPGTPSNRISSSRRLPPHPLQRALGQSSQAMRRQRRFSSRMPIRMRMRVHVMIVFEDDDA